MYVQSTNLDLGVLMIDWCRPGGEGGSSSLNYNAEVADGSTLCVSLCRYFAELADKGNMQMGRACKNVNINVFFIIEFNSSSVQSNVILTHHV